MPRRNPRPYRSERRQAGAQATRHAILAAAAQLFTKRGYVGTTMPAIAAKAGVALDTVYAAVGKKPALFRLLIESAISGEDEAVPAEQRDYVRALRGEPDAAKKLAIYAAALGTIHPRLTPLLTVLQSAQRVAPELRNLWHEIAERRAANMHLFARELAATGELRPDLSIATVADIIWSMNAPEFYLLLVEERGWKAEQFAAWLADAWARLLLSDARAGAGE